MMSVNKYKSNHHSIDPSNCPDMKSVGNSVFNKALCDLKQLKLDLEGFYITLRKSQS